MAETTKHPVDDEANIEERASSVNAVSDIENQRQINDLRSEYLDDRAASLNQWLVVIGLVLAFFAVAIPVVTGIAAYVAYTQFQRIESEAAGYLEEAKGYANEAAQYLKDIQAQKKIAEEVVSGLTSGDISKFVQPGTSELSPEAAELLQTIQRDPGASVIDKAIVEAFRLQQEGKTDDAIEQWGSIVNISEGIDNDIAAAAFFARGGLKINLGRHEEAISDAKEAIRLKPNYAEAYTLAGVSKGALDRHEEAISDLNEAIRLKPNYAEAYFIRGLSKRALDRHEEVISDLNEAIRLNPNLSNLAEAYFIRGLSKRALDRHEEAISDLNEAIRLKPYAEAADVYFLRGMTKAKLGKIEEAKVDCQIALKIAEQQGNEDLKATIEAVLQGFKDQE
ncbi:MAG: hypothetical protein OYL97_11645 [Candidatus Poribacteria bacterium]|nr:hypothetical protein [Candidatus Poribacteria bacterium]